MNETLCSSLLVELKLALTLTKFENVVNEVEFDNTSHHRCTFVCSKVCFPSDALVFPGNKAIAHIWPSKAHSEKRETRVGRQMISHGRFGRSAVIFRMWILNLPADVADDMIWSSSYAFPTLRETIWCSNLWAV